MHRYFVHFIYAGSFLLAVMACLGYLVWSKHQAALERELRIEEQAKLAKLQEQKIAICIIKADRAYLSQWASACKLHAESNKSNLEQCIDRAKKMEAYLKTPYTSEEDSKNSYALQVSNCESLYETFNPESDCALPLYISDKLNTRHENEKNLCLNLNKIQ
jgi:hypothetical protein